MPLAELLLTITGHFILSMLRLWKALVKNKSCAGLNSNFETVFAHAATLKCGRARSGLVWIS